MCNSSENEGEGMMDGLGGSGKAGTVGRWNAMRERWKGETGVVKRGVLFIQITFQCLCASC